jgi:hypothetical protein
VLFYRAALPLSRKTLNYATGIIRRHLTAIGSPWRKLSGGQEALLVLACLRKSETFAQLAAGFGIGRTTDVDGRSSGITGQSEHVRAHCRQGCDGARNWRLRPWSARSEGRLSAVTGVLLPGPTRTLTT